MEASDSANTEMNYDHIESTIQPEDHAQPVGQRPEERISFACDLPQGGKRSSAEPEAEPDQPLEIPKPKKKGRPAGVRDTYKRTRKSTTNNTPISASVQSQPSNPAAFPDNVGKSHTLLQERYEQPMGVDMNTLADIMLDRMTVRASDARALKTQRWEKVMPHR